MWIGGLNLSPLALEIQYAHAGLVSPDLLVQLTRPVDTHACTYILCTRCNTYQLHHDIVCRHRCSEGAAMRLRLLLETPPSEHSSVLRADAAARARLVLHAGSCCTASHHTRELQADFCKVPAAPSAHVCVPYLLGTTKAHQGTPRHTIVVQPGLIVVAWLVGRPSALTCTSHLSHAPLRHGGSL